MGTPSVPLPPSIAKVPKARKMTHLSAHIEAGCTGQVAAQVPQQAEEITPRGR